MASRCFKKRKKNISSTVGRSTASSRNLSYPILLDDCTWCQLHSVSVTTWEGFFRKHVFMSYRMKDTTVEPRFYGPRLCGLFDYPDFFLWPKFLQWILNKLAVILKIQNRKKPNNPWNSVLSCALSKFTNGTRQRNVLMRSADIWLAQLFYRKGNMMLD